MIYLKKEQIERYKGISANLDIALNVILEKDLDQFVLGRNEIDGDNVFANRMSYETIEEKDAFFEAHLQYIDIHVILKGKEMIGVSHINSLEEFERNLDTDFIGYKGEIEARCNMESNDILIVFPEDAHMVKVKNKQSMEVNKIVFKVQI